MQKFCTTCGSTGIPNRKAFGSFSSELAAWIVGVLLAMVIGWFVLVAPLAYTIVRFARGSSFVCAYCGAATLVPVNSPVALKMQEDLELGGRPPPPILTDRHTTKS